jgi:sensor histidine kinase
MIHIALTSLFLGDKLIMFCFYFLCLITYFLQKRGYERNKLKNERIKYNEHINILLAENERNRIGQDLHDSIGHTFVMLKLKAELAEKYLQKNNIEAAKKELSEISKISKESMDNTRAIVNKLKHRTIEEEIKIIQDIMIMSDIQLNLINNFATKPTGLQEWTITMILKELTNNIIKHSKANKCDIILDESNNNYTITAKDNGCGFEVITGSELASIRERIKIVDGKIEILSKKEPTIIRVTISKNN